MKNSRYSLYGLLLVLPLFLLGCPPFPVTIITPSDGAQFDFGDLVVFTGLANDLQDGDLTGSSLVWTSSIDGQIGTGKVVSKLDLSAGTHKITLTATNSLEEKGTATITITIGTVSTTSTTTTSPVTTTTPATTTTSTPVATTIDVDVENFRFDGDDNNSTQVDTVTINAGDSVRWKWVEGSHTVTSGEGSAASDAGDLFDKSLTSGNQSFSFTFTEAGTFPYFCRPHEFFNMKGIIVVQ